MTGLEELVCAVVVFILECVAHYAILTWKTWQFLLVPSCREKVIDGWSRRHSLYGVAAFSGHAVVVFSNLCLLGALLRGAIIIARA